MESRDTPPTTGVYGEGMQPPSGTSWPLALGTISCVLAALGILIYSCNTISVFLLPWFLDVIEAGSPTMQQQAEMQREIMSAYLIPQTLSNLAGLVLAIFLMTIAIGLIRRRASAARGVRWWAWLKIIHALVVGCVSYLVSTYSAERYAEMAATDPAMAGMPAGVQSFMHYAGAGGSVLWALVLMALPAFMLWWFARSSTREEVAKWK